MPLVLHVYERCRLYTEFEEVLVATCDEVIRQAVIAHGGTCVMTQNTHERCTDRVEECIQLYSSDLEDDQIIVMVQGDEVLVSPDLIKTVLDTQMENNAPVVNLGSRLYKKSDQESTDTVKIVAGCEGQALYLSRSIVPSQARGVAQPIYQQTGIMAFTWKFLRLFSTLNQTPLEKAESIDMLRVLENNQQLSVVFTEVETLGVDTPEDLLNGVQRLIDDPITQQYLDLMD